MAFSTPYRMFKRYTYQGGVCDPLVIRWPAGIAAAGEVGDQYHHCTDIVPTILDVCGVEMPAVYNGATQNPLAGVSMRYSFDAGRAADAQAHPVLRDARRPRRRGRASRQARGAEGAVAPRGGGERRPAVERPADHRQPGGLRDVRRHGVPHPRATERPVTYSPGTSEVPERSAANVHNVSYKVLAEVELTPQSEGVIFATARASAVTPCSSRTAP